MRFTVVIVAAAVAVGCSDSRGSLVAPPQILVTPITVTGDVRSPAGEPVADATVAVAGRFATTNERGESSLEVMTANSQTFVIGKTGYETREFGPMAVTGGRSYPFVLRKAFRLTAGETGTLTLEAGDGGYEFRQYYSECIAPCKLVQVVVPAAGTMSVSFAAQASNSQLTVIAQDGVIEHCCASPILVRPEVHAGPAEVHFHVSIPSAVGSRVLVTTSFTPK